MLNQKEIRVLIAEDDFLVSEEITRIVKQIGYQHVGTAPNGLKAIEMVKDLMPDLVLMDIKMPKLNGLKASKIIQDVAPTPIVILTAHESQTLVDEASDCGVGAYLTKPPNADELERAVTIAFARQTDLIQSRELVKRLEKSEQNLQELNASKDKFFSIIAHDLRNPLSALIGYSNLMVDSYYEMNDTERIELSSSMKQITENVNILLEGLLQWSRYETGRMEFRPEIFYLDKEILEVINLLKPNADSKNIKLSFCFDGERKVFADKNMTKTILRNLISNAIKFTKQHGNIKIWTEVNDGQVETSIQDDGIGMTEEQVQDLFILNKSRSTQGTENEKGSGLGLLLCKELINKNRGDFNVSSKINEGTKVSFLLNLKENYNME